MMLCSQATAVMPSCQDASGESSHVGVRADHALLGWQQLRAPRVKLTLHPHGLQIPELSLAATWNTVWDIRAEVTPPTAPVGVTIIDDPSGAKVVVHAGVRVLLSQSEKDDACP